MTEKGFYCNWYMPFANGARIKLSNEGTKTYQIEYTISHKSITDNTANLGRFHAWWHRDVDQDERRPFDGTLLNIQGWGRYCGVMLHIWNPKGGWWGEGDEKFFIDGEMFPSTFGTGTEDYFGYAWCSEKLFHRAFHNQTVSVPQNPCAHPIPDESGGHTCNNRWHIADNIPFHTSFDGALEKYFPNDRPTRYDCVVYWYQEKAQPLGQALPSVEEQTYRQANKETTLFRFLSKNLPMDGDQNITSLRGTYALLIQNPTMTAYYPRLYARMARIEKTAGNAEKTLELIEPLLDKYILPFVDREMAVDILPVLGDIPPETNWIKPVLVHNADGSMKRIKKAGRWCIETEWSQGKPLIYFALPEGVDLRNKDRTVKMKVDYYCDGKPGNLFMIHYDSHLPPSPFCRPAKCPRRFPHMLSY